MDCVIDREERDLEQKQNWKRFFLLYVPFFSALIFWFVIDSLAFLQGDDYRFAIHGGTLAKIIKEYKAYYFYGGARMGNVLAGFFLLSGIHLWKIVTPFAATGLSLVFFYYIRGTFRTGCKPARGEALVAWLSAFFPCLLPMYGRLFSDVYLWLDGSTNYLYPMLLAMIGFLPFYNRLRGRPLPKALHWLSPVCLVLAALLHEQITIMLTVMCLSTLLYLRADGQSGSSRIGLRVMTVISAVILTVMLTAPGAYYRMKAENTPKANPLTVFFYNFLYYFASMVQLYWPWIAAVGLAAAYLLSHSSIKSGFVHMLKYYFLTGALLAACSGGLRLPELHQTLSAGRYFSCAEIALLLFWVIYFIFVLAALMICAHSQQASSGQESLSYLPVLYLGACASQAIPAVATTSSGRAKYPFFVLLLLITFCLIEKSCPVRWKMPVQAATLLVGFASLVCIARGSAVNAIAEGEIQRQISAAQQGVSDTILIDYNQFDWTYCNATFVFRPDVHSKGGYIEAMRTYYHLPETIEFRFTKAKTGRGIPYFAI